MGEDRDELLAELLADLSGRAKVGGLADVEAVAREHPSVADELRQLWAAAQFADLIAKRTLPATAPRLPSTPHSDTAPPAPPLTGRFGDYELAEQLGSGGMGVVYKARQQSPRRTVALKMMRDGQLASPEHLARFRAEAEAAGRLEHPHIVPVYEVGEHDGRAYICMPYIAGETLGARLARGPLPATEAARLIATVARAVHHAHRHGVLHRDLKPANVLLDRKGGPHVADFGLAKLLEPAADDPTGHTRTGAILGTPAYMSPEQATGDRGPLGPATDVYALGAILYECLTGRPPFVAANAVDLLLQVREQDPVPPRLLAPGVDRALEMICLKCLQKPADLRYASAAALAADLEAYISGESLSIRPGDLRELLGRVFRPTHHAPVMENWGLLWMAHSLFTLLLCALTAVLHWADPDGRVPLMLLWTVGLVTWSGVFWQLRRRAGPVTFVERQIAHAWAGGVAGSIGVLTLEVALGRPVLELAPALGVVAGLVFLFMAGILSGMFYFAVAALFASAGLMVLLPGWSMLIYGVTLAACYFIPGWHYWRRRRAARAAGPARGR